MVDHVVREARRSEREGLVAGSATAVAVLAERVRFWEPLAEDQGRAFDVEVAVDRPASWCAPREDGPARRWSTCCSTTSSPTPPRAPRSRVTLAPRPGGGLRADRRRRRARASPTDVDVVRPRRDRAPARPASASPSSTRPPPSPVAVCRGGLARTGGARVVVELGPPPYVDGQRRWSVPHRRRVPTRLRCIVNVSAPAVSRAVRVDVDVALVVGGADAR